VATATCWLPRVVTSFGLIGWSACPEALRKGGNQGVNGNAENPN